MLLKLFLCYCYFFCYCYCCFDCQCCCYCLLLLFFIVLAKPVLFRIYVWENGRSRENQGPGRITPGRDDRTMKIHVLINLVPNISEKMSRVYDDLILHITPDKFFIESLSEQQVEMKNIQGVTKKQLRDDATRRKSSLIFKILCGIHSLTYFSIYDSWNKNPLVLSFSKCGLPFFAFNVTGDFKNFDQISI